MRYRNDGTMPLNYGDHGPWVEPGETFDTADYPKISGAQIESHLASRFISAVDRSDVHVHTTRDALDALTSASGVRSASLELTIEGDDE